ncbi:BnaC06g43490D [Brassica napus]|uniref:BnaC06g43490D protein n=1 Tax=Brassica napus TaxID=3708 RepID=A0A078K0H7_BRANA|nr:BnaC06g43490D [Brassica napus]
MSNSEKLTNTFWVASASTPTLIIDKESHTVLTWFTNASITSYII